MFYYTRYAVDINSILTLHGIRYIVDSYSFKTSNNQYVYVIQELVN